MYHACYSVRDISNAKSRGPSGRRSEVRSPEGFSIDSSIARIGTLHQSVRCGSHHRSWEAKWAQLRAIHCLATQTMDFRNFKFEMSVIT